MVAVCNQHLLGSCWAERCGGENVRGGEEKGGLFIPPSPPTWGRIPQLVIKGYCTSMVFWFNLICSLANVDSISVVVLSSTVLSSIYSNSSVLPWAARQSLLSSCPVTSTNLLCLICSQNCFSGIEMQNREFSLLRSHLQLLKTVFKWSIKCKPWRLLCCVCCK